MGRGEKVKQRERERERKGERERGGEREYLCKLNSHSREGEGRESDRQRQTDSAQLKPEGGG